MLSKTKKWWFIAGFLVLALVVVSLYSKRSQYYYLKPKKGDVLEAIYGLGKVQTDKVYELKIGVISNVDKLFVKEGDRVKAGQKLISFDNIKTFRAPFAGIATSVEFHEGEVVSPQVVVLRLEDLDKKFIQVSLEQDAALKVRPGQTAKLVFQSMSAGTIVGKVERIYPKEGDFIARIQAENIDPHVLPGMTADVVIEVGSKKDVILLPIKAVSSGQVIVKRDGRRKKIDVSTGHTDGLWTELIEGDVHLSDELLVKGK
jgi:multidrug efflux pump subunit AcrA (membrane-fusion protein)